VLYPPDHIPRVDEENAAAILVVLVKSPKSVAFPRVEIVTYSIVFSCGFPPPPKTPLVVDAQDAPLALVPDNHQNLEHFQ